MCMWVFSFILYFSPPFLKTIFPQYNLLQRSFYTRVKLSDVFFILFLFFANSREMLKKLVRREKEGRSHLGKAETEVIHLYLGGGVLPNFSL